jgi:hypothetical protein
MKTIDTTKTAQALYGLGWHQLPEFVKEAAADFVADLLDMDARDVVSGDALDRVHECADSAVPVYDYHRYEVLADPRAVRAIEAAVEEFGADAMKDADGRVSFAALVGVGMYGAISGALSHMLYDLNANDGAAGFEALGLDADAAEVAAALLPEWSGTVRELVEAAPRLAADTLAVTQ